MQIAATKPIKKFYEIEKDRELFICAVPVLMVVIDTGDKLNEKIIILN